MGTMRHHAFALLLAFAALAGAAAAEPAAPIEIPVLRQPLQPGAIIEADDLVTRAVSVQRLRAGTITRAEDIVGKTPRRALRAGIPLDMRDVEAPRLVRRGEQVSVAYVAGGIRLEMSGRALDDGARGETIRIQNTKSAATIEAVVTGPGTASAGQLPEFAQ